MLGYRKDDTISHLSIYVQWCYYVYTRWNETSEIELWPLNLHPTSITITLRTHKTNTRVYSIYLLKHRNFSYQHLHLS